MVSAGFVHLLGDAIEDMGTTDFPVAPLLCATGLLMTIIADAIASSYASGGEAGSGSGCCGAPCKCCDLSTCDGALDLQPGAKLLAAAM